MSEDLELKRMATDIVCAYVSNNEIELGSIPKFIVEVMRSMGAEAKAVTPIPAVPIDKSIAEDYIICLDDGLKFQSLKRHLRTKYGISPEEYRERWGLSKEYPMVAVGYSKKRSQLAKDMSLGKSRKPGAGLKKLQPTSKK